MREDSRAGRWSISPDGVEWKFELGVAVPQRTATQRESRHITGSREMLETIGNRAAPRMQSQPQDLGWHRIANALIDRLTSPH
jgi:hypothetical protein